MNRVLMLDPSIMWARLTRADLYNHANRPDLAVSDFEKITVALPHRPHAYAGLGDSARLQGDWVQAHHYYRAALKRKPGYQYVQRRLAEIPALPEK